MTISIIIGIAGGSGSDKTTLTNALVDRFDGSALLISHVRYYRYMSCGKYDLPAALETDLMITHLNRLRSDQSVKLPVYDMICNSKKFQERESCTLILLGFSWTFTVSSSFSSSIYK